MKGMTWADFIKEHCSDDGSKCGRDQFAGSLGCETCFNEFTKEYFLKDSDWLLALSTVGAAVTNRERLNAAKNDFSAEGQRVLRMKMQEDTFLEVALENEKRTARAAAHLGDSTLYEVKNKIYGGVPCTLANAASDDSHFYVTTDARLTPAAIFPCEHCAYEWGKKAFPQGFMVKRLNLNAQLVSEQF